ncbi:hypothetical protein [Photorhabdus laumondii]|uniref:Uncharacterized protein n=1 Tax=Photorhabdus laumondii subsp. clarkei TaxID=2029685 RepID=A0A329VBX5_9GAMM|nr:hypothetical protein [Photorhabdus laumondii]RAW87457.1 hypothetical protein CKY01_16835 [Photorhabdus laumondii subsp. clarkei]
MTIELRKLFEIDLQNYLKSNFNLDSNVKFLKNEISIKKTKNNASSGDIGFRFLNNAHGYILYTGVNSPELLHFFKEVNPPYRSNKPENVVYSMNTSMENGFKSFSPTMRGTVDLPRNEEERKKTCEWIYTKVRDIYLPRTMNLIEIKPDAIKDITSFPDYYAYPFLTILYIIKKNNILLSDLDIESIFNKNITGNKSFDKNLLDTYL